jgi:membrane protein
VGILLALLVGNTILNLMPHWFSDVAEKAWSVRYFSDLLIFAFLLLIFFLLYWGIPNTKVGLVEAWWGAVVASLGAYGATEGFTAYLGSGLSNYNLVYGSLGAIVALLFWLYLLNLIVFLGAHLSAAIAQHRKKNSVPL